MAVLPHAMRQKQDEAPGCGCKPCPCPPATRNTAGLPSGNGLGQELIGLLFLWRRYPDQEICPKEEACYPAIQR